MIEIVRDQVVYNAGSNLEVACIYKNTTGSEVHKPSTWGTSAGSTSSSKGSSSSSPPRMSELDVIRILEASKNNRRQELDVPKNTILWMHNGKRFSHRNRRRYEYEYICESDGGWMALKKGL